jgi:transcriptional regulator with XRE-family HTH domain
MSSKLRRILGGNVRRARANLDLPQMKLAESCGLSTSYIGEIELGKKFPSAQNIERLAAALGLHYYELFFEDEALEVFDRHAYKASFSRDLRQRLDREIEAFIRLNLK